MTKEDLPTIEYLHKRLRCEPETGKLFWRDCEDMPTRWRTRWAGTEALATIRSNGYRQGAIDRKRLLAHRVIWAMQHGEWPLDQIDHINGVKADNRIINLRVVSCAENHRNMPMSKNNTSGATGVYWNKASNAWRANIKVDGRDKHLGYFDTIAEAAAARTEANITYGFTDRHGT